MTQIIPLNLAWNFRRHDAGGGVAEPWSTVDLPHSPFVADLNGREHWFGECEYQRTLTLPLGVPAGRTTLYIGAAMHSVVASIDGIECGRHSGGYLPFEIDLTAALHDGRPHLLSLRLDNRDNPDVPPGKPYEDLDFCWYGGLYRSAELRCYPAVHITDAVGAGAVASGGIFVQTVAATPASATVSVKTHVRNSSAREITFHGDLALRHGTALVGKHRSNAIKLAAGSTTVVETELIINQPALWQPDAPSLHDVQVSLITAEGTVLDARTERFGIRRISFSRSEGFSINGQSRRLRGTNRHQEYPRVGYAVPAAAQQRDARRIKEAGFDYVRLSHYPQSPEFLDACDELGIVVMNCIPGWQFIGGEKFRAACVQNARDLIRRDRNHPCVVLWELSLNETPMDEIFMARLHAAGHEEYPGDQMFTCGWEDRYDVYVHSRQHGKIHSWKNGNKALVIAEYGDWEFYASNHGFDQKTGAGIYASWSHGRQLRQSGERGLLQQSSNHIIALNDTLSSPAVLDGQWSIFDYARGYDANRAACGIMDIFRLPKFSYYFYRSQRDASEAGANWTGGAVVYIASHWTPASNLRIYVFSNCDEVELHRDGQLLGRQRPSKAWMTQYLPHAPFVFDLASFSPGILEAHGFIGSQRVASHRVISPAAPKCVTLDIDTVGITAKLGAPDVLIAHARILDSTGTLCVTSTNAVSFTIEGGAEIVGPASPSAEAGMASVVIRIPAGCETFTLRATGMSLSDATPSECAWKRG